ncbi:MAG: hypothetical protein ACRD27_12405 [Terracidiphilus sp.]
MIVRIVLCLVVYFISQEIMWRMLDFAGYVTAKSGAPGLLQALRLHPFERSAAVGLLAGFIPLNFWISIFGYFKADIPRWLRSLELDRMKYWVVVLISPMWGVALTQWVIDWNAMHSKHLTVLSGSSSAPISAIFEGFFSTNCTNVSDIRLDLWGNDFQYKCALHLIYVSIFFSAAAYSLAPFVRASLLSAFKFERPVPADEAQVADDSENKMAERTDEQ